ncbi:uncharacterized protein LOC105228135 isoform X3 [Bactrocera dorsalis]|uniref:Uncharacterized protein LOC105228135 isoform X3 n=1 Tax=Bactrocera dorsalis TaxID=27457 RepID=A0ABM3K6N3_BACDO|nr:uncharacterized protein LOC105228135 isoform X3 [Bactrocera dorsalis]
MREYLAVHNAMISKVYLLSLEISFNNHGHSTEMNRNLIQIKLILFVLGSWSYKYVNTLTVINDHIDRSSNGISFYRHNNERSQLPFLSVYYPNHMWRRKRVHLFPSKKYPYRAILTLNQNDKRYFPLRNLAPTKNMKWSNYMFPYKNFNQLLKTTPRTSYFLLSEENMSANFQNREQYLSRPILSTISTLQNNCVHTHNLNIPHGNKLALCVEKMPTIPTTVEKVSLTKTKYISNISQFDTTTSNPYIQYFGHSTRNTLIYNFFHATTVPNSKNTSHIYFTIGDAITTPRTPSYSQLKLFKKQNHQSENNGSHPIINYKIHRSNTATQYITSSPTSLPEFSNNAVKYSISDNETKNQSKYVYAYENSSVDTTKENWVIGQSIHNCSNALLETNNHCASGDRPNIKEFISKMSQQTTTYTLGSYPIKTTVVLGTISTPITELPYLDNTSTTAIWNAIETSKYSGEKTSVLDKTSNYPPLYRRAKFIQNNKRLVFKESLKNKNRNIKTTSLPTPIRPLKQKISEKENYPSSQTSTTTQTKEHELLHDTVGRKMKKAKSKFHGRSRFRWTPSFEKSAGNVNNSKTTSSTIATVFTTSTQVSLLRNRKTNTFNRSKLIRHNKRTNIVQTNTTRSVINLHLQSTTPLASSTPESAIMRISSISGVKMLFPKNNITNSIGNFPKASNAFIAELPIVTYFKEVTESRKA